MNARTATQNDTATVYDRLSRLLGESVGSEADTYRLARRGLTSRMMKHLLSTRILTPQLIAPETTVRRRLKENSRFPTDESERALRVARIYSEAELLFQDEGTTRRWFETPGTFIDGEPPITPMALAATDTGARILESKIRRTAYGIL